MKLSEFCIKNNLCDKSEIDKVTFIVFYKQLVEKKDIVTIKEIGEALLNNNLCSPNIYRLQNNIKKDKKFINKKGGYVLTQKAYLQLKNGCSIDDFENIESNSEFLDESLFVDVPTYLLKLAKQINNAYNNHLWDATAVLVRRVFEILLIKSYQCLNISDEIRKNGGYITLEKIIDNAVQNKILDLSRAKKDLNAVREIGNFSAHKLEYNANINDLNSIKEKYRVIVEELLYKSGLKK